VPQLPRTELADLRQPASTASQFNVRADSAIGCVKGGDLGLAGLLGEWPSTAFCT
jgi:hypothetical protein